MSNTQFKAPSLQYNGQKNQHNPTNQTYQIPQRLCDIIFNTLKDKSAQLRVMLVLIGTKEGFFISNKWICERTGLQQPSYNRALKELEKRGWITHFPYQTIKVNFNKIYADGHDI